MTDAPTCRSCGAGPLAPVLDLGRTPLANALLTAEVLTRPEATYPLELCLCPACALLQLSEAVPPEMLFADYPYFSSYSDTMTRHAEALATKLMAERQLGPSSLVVELASNDGYLLRHYKERGVPVLGVEPAANVARVAVERHGIPTVTEFFGLALAERLAAEGTRADVLHAHNVLAHVPDLPGFVAGMALLLAPEGIAVIEMPYAKDLIDRLEFDTIYHEHLFYFTLTPLVSLFERHGLVVRDVERVAIHGGSLRLTVGRGGTTGSAVTALLATEEGWGVRALASYTDFPARVHALQRSLASLLTRLKAEGKRIVAYGASAKGATLLNTSGIGAELLDYVVDRSPIKQGRYTPGSHLLIHDPAWLLTDQPDYALLLTWNFAAEILAQQAVYRERGGRFIVPIPVVRIL